MAPTTSGQALEAAGGKKGQQSARDACAEVWTKVRQHMEEPMQTDFGMEPQEAQKKLDKFEKLYYKHMEKSLKTSEPEGLSPAADPNSEASQENKEAPVFTEAKLQSICDRELINVTKMRKKYPPYLAAYELETMEAKKNALVACKVVARLPKQMHDALQKSKKAEKGGSSEMSVVESISPAEESANPEKDASDIAARIEKCSRSMEIACAKADNLINILNRIKNVSSEEARDEMVVESIWKLRRKLAKMKH